MSENISNDSYKILCLIYKEYLQRRKEGTSKNQAIFFNDYGNFAKEHMPETNKNDVYISIVELHQNGYIKKYIDGGFILLSKGIELMENRFKNGLSEIMDFISKIPFI